MIRSLGGPPLGEDAFSSGVAFDDDGPAARGDGGGWGIARPPLPPTGAHALPGRVNSNVDGQTKRRRDSASDHSCNSRGVCGLLPTAYMLASRGNVRFPINAGGTFADS